MTFEIPKLFLIFLLNFLSNKGYSTLSLREGEGTILFHILHPQLSNPRERDVQDEDGDFLMMSMI